MMCGNTTGECIPKPEEPIEIHTEQFTNVNRKSVVNACQVDPVANADTKCLNNATACKDFNDQLVCCMYANGICCGKNGLCCPNGYTCDSANEACQLNDDVIREPVKLRTDENNDVDCGLEATKCQSGCCDSQNAVCCSDGLNWYKNTFNDYVKIYFLISYFSS